MVRLPASPVPIPLRPPFRPFLRTWAGALALALLPVAAAPAGVTLGRGKLTGTATARVDYDSNLFLNNRNAADWAASLRAEGQYLRDAGLLTLESTAGFLALRFRDYQEQNAFDPYVEANSTYRPSDKTDARAALAFRRQSVANDAVNDRTRADDFSAEGAFEHLVTEKLGWRAAGEYLFSNYLTPGYSDVGRARAGLHGVHQYSPKLKLLAGLTAAANWTRTPGNGRTAADARDWRFTVGAEGEFSPKITGDLSVGVVRRELTRAGIADDTALYLASRVAWAATEKTIWTLRAAQDLGMSAVDQSMQTLEVSLHLSRTFTSRLVAEGVVGFARAEYRGFAGLGDRDDHGGTIRGVLRYTLGRRATLDAAAGWRENRSTESLAVYRRVNTSLGVTMRF